MSAVMERVGVAASPSGTRLVAHDVSVRYGGVQAVSAVSLEVCPGQLVGLIGPNGAGKTSLIDALTGYAPSAEGVVKLGERELTRHVPHRRARHGLVRTFQNLEIFDDLTVAENIRVAARGSGRGACPLLDGVMAALRLDRHLEVAAGDLSQGERRNLALARAVACNPAVLVLDEPAAGLDTRESAELGRVLRSITASGIGILLVDHDMSLVLSVSDSVYVLEFGSLIARGTPDEIRRNPEVRRAYLGVEQ